MLREQCCGYWSLEIQKMQIFRPPKKQQLSVRDGNKSTKIFANLQITEYKKWVGQMNR